MTGAPTTPQDGPDMGTDGFDHHDGDERMSPGLRAFWTAVSAVSAVLLYLAVVCALPRGTVGY